MNASRSLLAASALIAVASVATPASAATCVGDCGVMGPNGVVTAPPGGTTYGYITSNGVSGVGGIPGVGSSFFGSTYTSDTFAATAGQVLTFNFNYVTTDGSSTYTDYTWAALVDSSDAIVAYLFTARTTPTGDTSPGFGLPANAATLSPSTSPIITVDPTYNVGPAWSALADSGECYDAGCGYTGWITSNYTVATAGTYSIRFGVTNIGDSAYQSGLAFSGLALDGTAVDTGGGSGAPTPGAVPEPATWAMMVMGFGLIGSGMRRRKAMVAFA